jgi:glycosyltransferase involved in cell wall biosynthesis
MNKIVLVTNEPPPYRVPVFDRIARSEGARFHVIFCCKREPNRNWNLPAFNFNHTFLKERIVTRNGRYIHNNPDIVPALRRLKPDVLVNDGMNPTHIYAFLYAAFRGIPHVPLTDGTDVSEASLGSLHVAVRKIVYGRSRCFVAASEGGIRLFERYGAPRPLCYLSPLCADNDAYRAVAQATNRPYDLVFSGRMVEAKNPGFALEVARGVARRLGRRSKILFIGSGPLDSALMAEAAASKDMVEATFTGFARQEELPAFYGSGKVFLFPTAADVWGVVANEACAAGLPVIVSPFAGAAGELVVDGLNGYVLRMDAQSWADHAAELVSDTGLWHRFSDASVRSVSPYSFDRAAAGILDAANKAVELGKDAASNLPLAP